MTHDSRFHMMSLFHVVLHLFKPVINDSNKKKTKFDMNTFCNEPKRESIIS